MIIFVSYSKEHDKIFSVCFTYKRLWVESSKYFRSANDRKKYCKKYTCEFEKIPMLKIDGFLKKGRELGII